MASAFSNSPAKRVSIRVVATVAVDDLDESSELPDRTARPRKLGDPAKGVDLLDPVASLVRR
jgi:hypothetical protein